MNYYRGNVKDKNVSAVSKSINAIFALKNRREHVSYNNHTVVFNSIDISFFQAMESLHRKKISLALYCCLPDSIFFLPVEQQV
jgi:hypothetical protein